MGQVCCNYQPKDKNALNYGGMEGKPTKIDPALNDLLAHAKQNEQKVVQI